MRGAVRPRLRRAGAIQSKIERKHIDARLAEDTEGATLDMLGDELPNAFSGKLRAFAMRGTWK